MKALSNIFAVYILLLAFVPAVLAVTSSADLEHCRKPCCTETRSAQEKQKKDCGQNVCNPFLSCCSAYALAAVSQAVAAPLSGVDKKFPLVRVNLNACFLANAWHPPKSV